MLYRTKNIKKNITAFWKTKAKKMKIVGEGINHCKGVIYWAIFKNFHKIYTREPNGTLSKRISKGKNNILKRPNNNELTEHFDEDHDFAKNVNLTILELTLDLLLKEGLWIYCTQQLKPISLECSPKSLHKLMH